MKHLAMLFIPLFFLPSFALAQQHNLDTQVLHQVLGRQGTPDHAAVAGDFAMSADEVAPVIEALTEHGITVVAVHNHMVKDEPRVFFCTTGASEKQRNWQGTYAQHWIKPG